MKYKNNLKYSLPVALLLFLLLGAGSCVREELNVGGDENYSSVTIKVKMPEQTVKDPMSRGVAADYDEVRNMNIMVSDKGFIKKRVYLDFANMTWGDGTTTITNGSSSGGVTITYKDVDGFRLFELAFADDYWTAADGSSIPLKTCQFHAVANWDGQITDSDDRDLVANLRRLKATSNTVTINGKVHVVPNKNIMYGEIVKEDTEVIDETNRAEVRRVVTIGLKRTAAMITLRMDGADLARGVIIELTDVTLRNVPTSCTLGPGNKANRADISDYGDRQGGPTLAGGRLVGKETQEITGFGSDFGYLTSIGGHYPKNGDNITNTNSESVQPLFLFENMQGSSTNGNTDETMKRPDGVEGTKMAIANYNQTGVCSYIEVNATYTQCSGTALQTIEERGTATWRFFLGEDITTNFDVARNTNYQLTLTLTGTAIGEAESSWRVDTDLEKPDVIGDANMVVGGGGEMFCVEFNNNISTEMNNIKLVASQANAVYVCVKSGNRQAWIPVTTNDKEGAEGYITLDNKQIWFYVQPLMPDDTEYFTGDKRECTVTFKTQNNTPVTSVTFTQYRPLTVTVTAEEVKEGCDECMQRVKRLIENYYNHSFETGEDFTFYVDRVDRDPMQWGFYGVELDKNLNTGFENVYHLIDPLPGNKGDKCDAHIEYAKNYLPTGKGWREENGHIDYTRGSCMMHAAMENYWQSFYPYPGANGTTVPLLAEMVNTTTLPTRPADGDGVASNRRYAWSVPSIVGWQMLEILDKHHREHGGKAIFDPAYPIAQWTSYWTSNYGALELKDKYPSLNITGLHRSFVYQFGMDLDRIGTDDLYPGRLLLPRNTMVRYRLINVKPEKLK